MGGACLRRVLECASRRRERRDWLASPSRSPGRWREGVAVAFGRLLPCPPGFRLLALGLDPAGIVARTLLGCFPLSSSGGVTRAPVILVTCPLGLLFAGTAGSVLPLSTLGFLACLPSGLVARPLTFRFAGMLGSFGASASFGLLALSLRLDFSRTQGSLLAGAAIRFLARPLDRDTLVGRADEASHRWIAVAAQSKALDLFLGGLPALGLNECGHPLAFGEACSALGHLSSERRDVGERRVLAVKLVDEDLGAVEVAGVECGARLFEGDGRSQRLAQFGGERSR